MNHITDREMGKERKMKIFASSCSAEAADVDGIVAQENKK